MLMTGAVCEGCGETFFLRGHASKKELVTHLRSKGWSVGRGTGGMGERTCCPFCKRKGTGKEEE